MGCISGRIWCVVPRTEETPHAAVVEGPGAWAAVHPWDESRPLVSGRRRQRAPDARRRRHLPGDFGRAAGVGHLPGRQGRTGIAGATANGAMYATGTGSGTSTAALTNGQILIGRSATTPVAGAITGTAPISLTLGSGTIAVSIANAAADASTKGAVSFVADDMNCTAGVCGIDYTNAQKASGGQPGLLTAADWNTFNTKGNCGGPGVSVDSELALFSGTGGQDAQAGHDDRPPERHEWRPERRRAGHRLWGFFQ